MSRVGHSRRSLSSWESLQRIMTFKTTLERLTIKKTYSRQLRMLMMVDRACLIRFRGGQDGDLIMAFFPCIYFSDMSQILHTWGAYPKYDCMKATDIILDRSNSRHRFYQLCIKMLAIAKSRGLRMIMENPWGTQSFLRNDFVMPPAIVDRDRSLRGDYFSKPTAYWYINCEPTRGLTIQKLHKPKRVKKDAKPSGKAGQCSEERSMISPDYARNFICDFILGKEQIGTQLNLF